MMGRTVFERLCSHQGSGGLFLFLYISVGEGFRGGTIEAYMVGDGICRSMALKLPEEVGHRSSPLSSSPLSGRGGCRWLVWFGSKRRLVSRGRIGARFGVAEGRKGERENLEVVRRTVDRTARRGGSFGGGGGRRSGRGDFDEGT